MVKVGTKYLALLSLPVIVLALTACAGPRGDVPYAETVAEVACTDGSPESQPAMPVPGRVPVGFEAVAAYRCDALGSVEDAQGRWSAVTQERLEGDLGPLLAALGEPDDPRWWGPCTTIGIIVPELWLVDAAGEAFRVSYPVTGCGLPKTDAISAALNSLKVVETAQHKRELIESRAAMDSGCPTNWSATPLHVVSPGDFAPETGKLEPGSAPTSAPLDEAITIPMPDVLLPSNSEVDGMLVCGYSTDPADAPSPAVGPDGTATLSVTAAGSGWFTDARTLDPDHARLVLDAARSAGPADPRCTLIADRFVLLFPTSAGQPVGQPLSVELDGCQRLIHSWATTLNAPPGVLAALGLGEGSAG